MTCLRLSRYCWNVAEKDVNLLSQWNRLFIHHLMKRHTYKYTYAFKMVEIWWFFKSSLKFESFAFLAHLSRRLTRWAYSIPMVRRPSVVVRQSVRRRPHFQTWISLKPVGQSWSNFMCSITGMGERLHKVWGQIGWKLWFLWQQKAPIDL